MVGSPGVGTLEFNISLVKTYLEEGQTVIFATADMHSESILDIMERFGIDVNERLGRTLYIIDYHSSLLGSFDDDDRHKAGIQYVVDLEGIMFNIDSIASETGTPVRIFLHSLSTLFLYNQPNVVLKFFQISSSKISSDYGAIIFTLHEGVHADTTVNHLMAIANGVIEMRFDADMKRRMRIRHMCGCVTSSQWIPFEIKQIQGNDNPPLLEWK